MTLNLYILIILKVRTAASVSLYLKNLAGIQKFV